MNICDYVFRWGRIIRNIRTGKRYTYVHPLASNKLFRMVFKNILPGKCYYVETIRHPNHYQLIKYVHIPITDMENDIMINLHWTGSVRFNPDILSNRIYKVKYSSDTSLKNCARFLTHGNIELLKLDEDRIINDIINEYYFTKGAIYRFFLTNDDLIYTNPTLFVSITSDGCFTCSLGFATGLVKDVKPLRAVYSREQVSPDHYFYNTPVVAAVLDALTLKVEPDSYIQTRIRRHRINITLTTSRLTNRHGIFLLVKPHSRDMPPLAIPIDDENLLTYLVSMQSLMISLLISQIITEEKASLNNVKDIYNMVYGKIYTILSIRFKIQKLSFDDVLSNVKYFIEVNNHNNLELLDIRQVIRNYQLRKTGTYSIVRKLSQSKINVQSEGLGLRYFKELLKKGLTVLL